MIYILLSACFSVAVSVLLKLAKRYSIDVFQAITWNYSIAIVLTWLFFRPQVRHLEQLPLDIYTPLAVLLPALFFIIALSVRTAGIVRTDVAQRLELFIPVLASFVIFHESLSAYKAIGLATGFAAILCAIPWQKQRGFRAAGAGSAWIYLLIVFVGMGVIDILLKKVAAYQGVSFTSSLIVIYTMAFALSLIVMMVMIFAGKLQFTLRHIFFGWILGIANFANIYFYLKAHQAIATNPSTVFSTMNITVIALGAIVGLVIFKEKLSTLNKVGLGLAVLAIIINFMLAK
ncbi:hypothetical protein C8P68_104429 [Mucilaginibacter yixingensis]|uniref:EamA-like transporter family protein n=1 Tax=Mucilaginibacter yixingensis TaxID=1295612 RepID=A0A2T5JA44_9SPHI|nr:DMT family transporter [Mucilaginibacter yixingensis]PTQ96935.1 hypothetical protein C8P68_104429 [Mucilaginibacter yixingensis]